jgi:hypothetical protein
MSSVGIGGIFVMIFVIDVEHVVLDFKQLEKKNQAVSKPIF